MWGVAGWSGCLVGSRGRQQLGLFCSGVARKLRTAVVPIDMACDLVLGVEGCSVCLQCISAARLFGGQYPRGNGDIGSWKFAMWGVADWSGCLVGSRGRQQLGLFCLGVAGKLRTAVVPIDMACDPVLGVEGFSVRLQWP